MNYCTKRLPLVTFVLMGLNTLIWLITFVCGLNTDGDSNYWVLQHLWLAPGASPWYSWLTSMFVHANFLHLFGNMIFLFLFGCCVEDIIGRGRFLLCYLLGGFAAELTFIMASPMHFSSLVPLGGASGAISACMGMFLWLRADVEIEFLYFVWFLGIRTGRFETPAWMAIGFWFLKDLLMMIWAILYPGGAGGGTAFGAHVGGLLCGVVLMALARLSAPKDEPTVTSAVLNTRELVADAVRKQMAAKTATVFETPTIFLSEDGLRSGPHTLTQIQARLTQHQLGPDALYWSEGMTEWASVRDLAEHPL